MTRGAAVVSLEPRVAAERPLSHSADDPDCSAAVADLRRRGAEAVAELVQRYRPHLARIVAAGMDGRLKRRVGVEDVLQETTLAAVQRLHHYLDDPAMPPFVWLRLVAQQTLIDLHRFHLKAQKRTAAREIAPRQWSADTSASVAGLFVAQLTSPSLRAVRDEVAEALRAVLATMRPIDKEVLMLRHFEELKNGEVADLLGIKPKAASIRYIRALAKLREALDGFPEVFGAEA